MKNLKGAVTCLYVMDIKPNYSALAREYGVDRRTAKKMYLGIQNNIIRARSSKLDKYQETIGVKLSIPGTNKKAVYEFLKDTVNDDIGSYSNFRKYIQKNKDILIPKKIDPSPRFETEMGRQLQFDWKGPMTLHARSGEEVIFYIFSTTLSASRFHSYRYSKFMTRESVQRCLIEIFQELGGVPQEILTDNMSSIVNYSQHKFVPEFEMFCKEMGTTPKKCKVGHAKTKGKDESCNRFINWLIPYDYEFDTENDLQDILKRINEKVNREVNQTTNMPPVSLFQKEKEYLQPLPKQDILDYYLNNMITAKVSKESLVYYKGAYYSVSPKYINQTVKLQEVDNKLYIYYTRQLIVMHEISNQKFNYKENDYIECLAYTMPDKGEGEIVQMAKKNLELLSKLTRKEGILNDE